MADSLNHAAAVLTSGGLDSAILCVEMLPDFHRVFPLYIRGGLRWEEVELASLRLFLAAAARPGLESLVVLEEPIALVYGNHWSTSGTSVPGSETPDEAVYLPGRNLLLSTKAAVWCHLRGIESLALGSLGSNPFPDSSPAFFGDLERLLNQAMDGSLRLIRPFDQLHKTDVLLRGKDLPLHLTFSCINPIEGRHCGKCNKCPSEKRLRRRGPPRPDDICWQRVSTRLLEHPRETREIMFRVTREIEFCYGHRLLNYDGKCRHLHGHNGRAVITLEGRELDSRGMLIDFGDIKKTVQQWIDDNLDHNMLLCRDDPILPVLEQHGERVFVMDCNPTAENIARLIHEQTKAAGLPVVEVVLWETEHCFSTYASGT